MDLSAPPASTPAPRDPADRARYAIGGTAPARVERPETREQLATIVRDASRAKQALVPWGGGIALSREPAPPRYDLAVDLTGLTRVTHHEPADFTVSAEAGVIVQDLRERLAAHRQELPLEAAEGWGATLGGVLAANASGPRRRTFGAPRDRLLGATYVTGDGVLARAGGRVVKNVAGYGVGRLLCGSRGGLAVIVEASLKLLPQPPARAALVHALDADAIADPKRWEHVARREPTVLTVVGRALASRNPVLASDAPFALVAGFEDDAAWVEAQCAFTRERLGPPRLRVSDASVPPLWQMLADLEEMPGPRLTFASAHVSPTALAPLLRRPFAERLLFHSPHGRLTIWPAPDEASALVAELAGHGFACIEARGLDDLGPGGRQPAVLALRQRVRGALDPSGTMAYGSRWASGA